MVCFQTKNANLGKFWRVLQWKMLVYFRDTWSILRSFVIFYWHLVYFVVIWYNFPVLVFCTKKYLATLVASRCQAEGIAKVKVGRDQRWHKFQNNPTNLSEQLWQGERERGKSAVNITSRVARCVFEKIALNVAPPFLSNWWHNFYGGKSSPQICATSVICKSYTE
jgi:hypothetical protein